MVGHTHEDIEQYFSCISRYFKNTLQEVLSPEEFLSGLMTCFKTPSCIPSCTERIECTFNTQTLSSNFVDPTFAKFDLNESTGDKVHSFMFSKNSTGHVVMQYKLKRYSIAMYPRKFDVADTFICPEMGAGIILSATPEHDEFSKKKYWNYSVRFTLLAVLMTPFNYFSHEALTWCFQ